MAKTVTRVGNQVRIIGSDGDAGVDSEVNSTMLQARLDALNAAPLNVFDQPDENGDLNWNTEGKISDEVDAEKTEITGYQGGVTTEEADIAANPQ